MDVITRTGDTLTFDQRTPPAVRVIIFLSGLFPLLAPYELLSKPRWQGYSNLPFLISLIFSLVALGFSLFIIFIAVFALNQRVLVDTTRRVLILHQSHLFHTFPERRYSLAALPNPSVDESVWSEGPNSYNLVIQPLGDKKITFGSFATRAEAEGYLALLSDMMDRPTGELQPKTDPV